MLKPKINLAEMEFYHEKKKLKISFINEIVESSKHHW